MRRRFSAAGASAAGASALALAILTLVAAMASGCGKKGPPRPPPRLIPAQTTDLVARQTGSSLVLELTYPAVTTSGMPLAGIEALEVLALRPPASAATVAVDPRTFAATASVVKRLEGLDLASATRGPRLRVALDAGVGSTLGPRPGDDSQSVAPAPTPTAGGVEDATAAAPEAVAEPAQAPPVPAAEGTTETVPASEPNGPTAGPIAPTPSPAGPPPVWLAVRSFGPRGNESPLSNLVAIVPRPPPAPPDMLTLQATAEGVRLTWTLGPGAGDGGAPIVGFDVLRRRDGEPSFETRIGSAGVESLDHLDSSATFGERYDYTVRTVVARDPLVESADGPVREIEYQDTFPPPVPAGLVALAEQGRVRLLWNRVEDAGLAGYRLYRQEEGGDEIELPREPGPSTEHSDGGVRAGVTYSYRVTAMDARENESARSEPATATPR